MRHRSSTGDQHGAYSGEDVFSDDEEDDGTGKGRRRSDSNCKRPWSREVNSSSLVGIDRCAHVFVP